MLGCNMEKFKRILFIPLMFLFFVVLPSFNVFAFELDSPEYTGYDFAYSLHSDTRDRYIYNSSKVEIEVVENTVYFRATSDSDVRIIELRNGEFYSDKVKTVGTGDTIISSTGDMSLISWEVLWENGYKPVDNRPGQMPAQGNGIFISFPKNGQVINSFDVGGDFNKMYPVTFQIDGRYQVNDFSKGDKYEQNLIINSLSSDYDIADIDFRWEVSPTKAYYNKDHQVKFRVTVKSYYRQIGEHEFNISCSADVFRGSEDFELREVRQYSDKVSFSIESDESKAENNTPSTGGGSNSDGGSSSVGGSFDDFPVPPNSMNPIDWIIYFADVLVWLVTFPFRLLAEIFSTLWFYIDNMKDKLIESSRSITQLFGFIPQDIIEVTYGIISFTLLYGTIKSVYKMIRG